MKRFIKEIVVLLCQMFMFYIFPVFMYLYEPIDTVMLILVTSFILSMVLTIISRNKIKYLYPIVIAILFIPTVFIYYNESALVHSVWYMVVSVIGLFIGSIINFTIKKMKK